MPSLLDEIVEQVKQNARLIIAEDYEICAQELVTSTYRYENGNEVSVSDDRGFWVGMRILHRKRPGKSATFSVGKDGLTRLVDAAFQAADVSTPDLWFRFPIWKALPAPVQATLQDESVPETLFGEVRVPPDSLEEIYESCEIRTLIVRRGEKLQRNHQRRVKAARFAILNHSTDRYYWMREESASAGPLTNLNDSLHALLERSFALRSAASFAASFTGELLLSPIAGAAVLRGLSSSFSAENVQAGRSPFSEKPAPLSSELTIIDDGTYLEGLYSAPFDMEGSPTQRTVLVDRGKVCDFLYDTYFATRENRLSTGNFVRHAHAALPKVSATNLYVQPGRFSPQALVSSISRGVLLESVEDVRLDASSSTMMLRGSGWMVERGVKMQPICDIPLQFGVIDMLRKVVGSANDLSFYGGSGAPSILFENVPLGV